MHEYVTRTITGIIFGVVFFGIYFYSQHLFTVLLGLIFAEIVIIEWPRLAANNKLMWLLVPLYPLVPILCLVYFNYTYRSGDILIPLYPFLISWVADTSAYISGTLWGKHKICPMISPKKSWEGLVGSFCGVIVLNLILAKTRVSFASFGAISGIILALGAFVGDFFESFLKRKAQIKDSGAILPGHGGLLDRFDSVFVVVVILIVYEYFGFFKF